MDIGNLLQEYNQIATLVGILAGFAFSAVIQLISTDKPGKITTAAIIVFSISTTMFLFALFAFVLGAAAIAELNREITELEGWLGYTFAVAYLGLNLFLVGVGLTGWIRSRITGIITTVFALITFCMIAWVFVSVIALFV
jgi:hypothetical protein